MGQRAGVPAHHGLGPAQPGDGVQPVGEVVVGRGGHELARGFDEPGRVVDPAERERGQRAKRGDGDRDARGQGIGAFWHEIEYGLGGRDVAAHQALRYQAGSQRDGDGGLRVGDPSQFTEQDRASLGRAVELALHQRAESGCQRPLGVVGGREAAEGHERGVAALDQLAADRSQLGDLE